MIDDSSEPASTTALRSDHLTGMRGRLAAPCPKLPTTQSPLYPATALLQIYPADSSATELAKARQIHPTYGATLEASRKSENRKAARTEFFFAIADYCVTPNHELWRGNTVNRRFCGPKETKDNPQSQKSCRETGIFVFAMVGVSQRSIPRETSTKP